MSAFSRVRLQTSARWLSLLVIGLGLGIAACGTTLPGDVGNGANSGAAGVGLGAAGSGSSAAAGSGNSTAGNWSQAGDGAIAGTGVAGVDADGCIFDGVYYALGESFKAFDGCNTCYCDLDNVVNCTQAACPGTLCGGRFGNTCAPDEYCFYDQGALCGRADGNGICVRPPNGCDQIYSPVCGCDGQTYDSACIAAAFGISVDFNGSCDPIVECRQDFDCPQIDCVCEDDDDDGICDNDCWKYQCLMGSCVEIRTGVSCDGSFGGSTCQEGEFCNYRPGAACGVKNPVGYCKATPPSCTAELAPVCACDGKTYSNRCGANAEGVSVAYEGKCN